MEAWNNRNHRRESEPYRVLVAVSEPSDLDVLLRTATAIAQPYAHSQIRVMTVTRSGTSPSWFAVPDTYSALHVELVTRGGRNISGIILDEVRTYAPDVLILGIKGELHHGRYQLGRTLDPVVQGATCDVMVQRGDFGPDLNRILIPAAGGPNAPRALTLARILAPDARIVALYVADERQGQAEVLVGRARLGIMEERLPLEDRRMVETKVVQAATPVEGILSEATKGYGLVIVGAGHEGPVDRFLFGDIPQLILDQSPIPAMVVRRRLTYLDSFWRRVWRQAFGLIQPLTLHEQAEVQKAVRRGSQPSPDFFVTLTLAAALAALGLLMNSSAIVIGAMIVAPLMIAILGMGLSIVLGDPRFFWRAAATTFRGVLLAVLMGFVIGLLVPGAEVTDEVLALASPTVLVLAVALAAGIAAAYAISRQAVSAALAGVAVAASLTPPLVSIGLALALRDMMIAGGAALTFLANLVAIVATSGFVFLFMGFRPQRGDPERATTQRRGFSTFSILLVLVAVPLVIITQRSLSEVSFRRSLESSINREVTRLTNGELVGWDYTITDEGMLNLDMTIRVSDTVSHAQARILQERIAQSLEMPVALSLSMVPVERLRAYVPPTPTPAPPPVGIAARTPTSPAPTNTATATPVPTPTPVLSPTQVPLDALTPTPWIMHVFDAGSAGLPVHYAPNSLVVGHLEEGAPVVVLEGPIILNGSPWYHIRSRELHLKGWVDAEHLTANP